MSVFTLKMIAFSSMLLDHLAVVFPGIFPFWFRGIGRFAWPIFAFLLAEGFRHTKSPEKFVLRLIAFALISEIPYDIAMGKDINFFSDTNIFYTLFLGGMAICLYERMINKYKWQTAAVISALFPTAVLAELLSTEYGGMGVLFIFTAYAIKPQWLRMAAVGGFALSQFIPLIPAHLLGIDIELEYWLMIPFAIVTLPLLALYNGKRGIQAKWLFYTLYPGHLLLLSALTIFL